jgi:hypothetical protein
MEGPGGGGWRGGCKHTPARLLLVLVCTELAGVTASTSAGMPQGCDRACCDACYAAVEVPAGMHLCLGPGNWSSKGIAQGVAAPCCVHTIEHP